MPKQNTITLDLDAYIEELNNNPLVFKASVLYADLPDEVSIRVDFVENILKLDEQLLADANKDLASITTMCRINGCKKIIISYVQKEVIE